MIYLKIAEKEDFDFYYKIKSERNNMFWTGHDNAPNKDHLYRVYLEYLKAIKRSDTRYMYIIFLNNRERIEYILGSYKRRRRNFNCNNAKIR